MTRRDVIPPVGGYHRFIDLNVQRPQSVNVRVIADRLVVDKVVQLRKTQVAAQHELATFIIKREPYIG